MTKALPTTRRARTPWAAWSWTPEYVEAEAALAFAPGGHVANRAWWVRGVSSAMDELTADTRRSYGEERAGAFARWQLQMSEFGPFVPLFQPAAHRANGDRVIEVPLTPLGTIDLASTS